MAKRIAVACGVLALVVGSFGSAAVASADSSRPDAAALCRELDADGTLAAFGITRGECVNLTVGPASDHANNVLAAFCGLDVVQADLGVSNKGQCIKLLRPS